ncbi:hypothetical protein FRC14_001296 [Serendipita sp. 396]|nr:hypothetical protein FRC14_001296 [Serendipita sp. 396]KAG8775181.1 hypothetical protein FRC15_000719 [Serendipita sp. 397]KAG8789424.1 hypothetical protein FRC16_001221 [Serendipita sp. 398]KAG8813846.1 hypothetical protein FRC18_002256 [Serendipita sp. 400]KAG8814918.1 hypothetical protein FRC19_001408 [Serendipita sp. 401]KAG8841547.1 hypothetical protein FRB91_004915 [Serendipita sp. 411]KAG8853176.1 hypothetical protein FRC20_001306 [Serendipita sp. 405]KAG9027307.1 hypothetical prot
MSPNMLFSRPHQGPEPEVAPGQTESSQFCEWDKLDNFEPILNWDINEQDLSSSSLSSSSASSPPSLSSFPSSTPSPSSSSSSNVLSSSFSLSPLSSSSPRYSDLGHRTATNHLDPMDLGPMASMLATAITNFGITAEEVS